MYVFDLDGTIALNEHRSHFVTRPKGERDWKSFNEASIDDKPHHALVHIMHALRAEGHIIAILSGRGSEVLHQTLVWLKEHEVPYDYIKLRDIGDHREDQILKLEMMKELEKHFEEDVVMAVFDDRKRVVDMWRENGYTCFQVAPGDF